MPEATTKDSNGFQEVIAGVKSGEISFEGLIAYDDDANPVDFADILIARRAVSWSFGTADGADAVYSGSGFLSSVEMSAEMESPATYSGSITINGAITATGDITAFYTSDKQLKTNIQSITNALGKTMSLSGVTFNWNALAEGKDLNSREPGVIAQEIQAVLPEAVALRDNGYLGVRYEKLVPLLIEAIKELNEKINKLEKS